MKLANCCGIKVQTRPRFTPKWTSPPYTPWRCRGQEALDEATPKGCPRLPDDAPRAGVQDGQTRSRATGFPVIPGTKTQLPHHRQAGFGVGNTTYAPYTW